MNPLSQSQEYQNQAHFPTPTPQPTLDLDQVDQWLTMAYPSTGVQELLHVASTGNFSGRAFSNAGPNLDIYDYIAEQDRQLRSGIYLAACTLRNDQEVLSHLESGGRGRTKDAARLFGIWTDIDIAGPGHKHDPAKYQGLTLPPDTDTAAAIIDRTGLPQPTIIIHSGGGLYAWWLLDQPAEAQLHADLVKGWQFHFSWAASQLGHHYGTGVHDLARVMRIPGTVNRKVQGAPTQCRILYSDGPRYSITNLHTALVDAELARPPAPKPLAVFVPSGSNSTNGQHHNQGENTPLNDFERRTSWEQILTPRGWQLIYQGTNGVTYWRRPDKPSGNHSATTGLDPTRDRMFCFSDAAGLPVQEPMTKQYVEAHYRTGGDMSALAKQLVRDGYGDQEQVTQAEPFLHPGTGGSLGTGTGHNPAPAPNPDLYFSKEGLLANRLAFDILSEGPLARGNDHILWTYQHGVWQPDRHVARNRATKLLGNRYRRSHVTNAEDIVMANVPTITCDPVNQYINFTNGLYDWREQELVDHSPEVMTTVQLAVAHNPQATCPRFDKFLTEVVPADMTKLVWEVIAYLLYSGNPLHKAIMLTGKGRNGKGTLLHVIQAVLGRRNITNVSLYDLTNTRFSTASLFGKLANIAGDIDAKYLETTAMFKAITGQDPISAEHKGKDRFDFHAWATPMFSANEIPASADVTMGYLSRWVIIPFPNSFLGREDRNLEGQLLTELEGIAAKAVTYLPKLMERGNFQETQSSRQAQEKFERETDPVRAWVHDICDRSNSDHFEHRTRLYDSYRQWCERENRRPVAAGKFYDRLEGMGIQPHKYHGDRGFKGLKIISAGGPATWTQQYVTN